jgi:hypothetical protein
MKSEFEMNNDDKDSKGADKLKGKSYTIAKLGSQVDIFVVMLRPLENMWARSLGTR